ncbi:fatty acid desaturase [Lichenibacterium dinghuense]|uniref:fatty acid desaturase n=1 Tax=Lichenibacterium dinghuense TaxID=2895977 RepID=UPI001F02819D|nr:fatty acid desaturase [Lichenibacterium sp. 6Y81]
MEPQARLPHPQRARGVEWPSVALCAGVYGGFGALTWWHASLPAPLVALGLAALLTLQASMQHEFIHGHPTRWRRLNRALAAVPLSLWLPFESYRRTHLVHHRDESLTDPFDDPESWYWSAEAWARLGPAGRGIVRFQTTLLGRLALGPAWIVARYLAGEARAVAAGARGARRIWLGHAAAAGGVAAWVFGFCGLSPAFYLLAVVYPSTSLLLLRSFAEHRAAEGVGERTAIVENAPVLGFLFLYNNLHAAHHERPLVPWYALPRLYRAERARLVEANRGLVYDGYGDVARRFLLVPHDAALHPDHREDAIPEVETLRRAAG